ncbi:cation-translocating P-type ATPase [Carboxydochorda subterranea]|uniref:Cation-translocating P-type ATPase n=1 Tax=Carboxydichorda subterranea TaxID=3109565 RepID=A0ABZ1C038_9FIRM|nr:cation-translocating P-type ATPase [Limnochorda sp. L945t]WRP18392.1 cation-translocating P-type ATPase [Limnochorda sp. L945t]
MPRRGRFASPRAASGSLLEGAERLSIAEVFRRLQSDPHHGLSQERAAAILMRHGANEIPSEGGPGLARLIWEQMGSFMTLVLLGAAALSWLLGEEVDAMAIVAIVVLNTLLGVAQEYRAEKAIAALSRWQAPRARAVRSGRVEDLPARELVVGDLLLLEEGDRVPADARLVQAFGLMVEEAALTGESVPVSKAPADGPLPGAGGWTEMSHMVFTGTTVVAGSARALVVRTGTFTELGTIARMVAEAPVVATPLQHALDHLGRWLVGISAAAVAVVFLVGILQGQPWLSMFLIAISLAVAAIPEGLPAAVTAALALGVQRMSKRRAIVRRLNAVESLGCASIICADKTGTLTRNEMTLEQVVAPWGRVEVTGQGFEPRGTFSMDGAAIDPLGIEPLHRLLRASVLCNHADVTFHGGRWQAAGDPTEAALVCAARKAGLDPVQTRKRWPILVEAPFQADRRMMSVAVRGTLPYQAEVYVKGSPDAVLARCRRAQGARGEGPLSDAERARVLGHAEALATDGLRVLAVAARRADARALPAAGSDVFTLGQALERDLTFLGLVALRDPPRPDVARALQRAREAHVTTVMITGDHPATARAVALQVGLLQQDEQPLTGGEIDRMDDHDLKEALLRRRVVARASPAHKKRLVRVLREAGHVVAMTGDGVNDAPALKEADIGVAMGLTGTDVARQAAALVLSDDNYATIVDAIEEGRTIYDNIRRFIRYLLGCNAGEVLVMLGAGILGLPVPLTALQILWVNLVTDGLPALALGLLPPTPQLMRRPPRPRTESLFAGGAAEEIAEEGLLIGATTLVVFAVAMASGGGLAVARTAAFMTLVLSQFLYALRLGAGTGRGGWPAPVLVGAVGVSLAMQLAVVSIGRVQPLFQTVALDVTTWVLAVGASVGTFVLRVLADRLGATLHAWARRISAWLSWARAS